MSFKTLVVPGMLLLSLSGCGYFDLDEKQQLEQAWLAKNEQLQLVIEQIRSQGLDAVATGAEAGSVAACVAGKLDSDPLGEFINVEGSLVESAQVAELLNELQGLMEQDISFEMVSNLLQKGADAAVYAKQIVADQGMEQGLESLQQMVASSREFASQDLGAHFQQLLAECQ
ncbi:lipoprotein [Shewanella hanedai]|jgi:hypothetical protein|uniref:Lipoprotein n=1 Tax=Shewanella hanedai TaxID=25 RepID=A0A553JSH1_SHEHA|nr:hypothetical protein [Shewanella hanedai]TRY15407.1 hypothetical protein FN961_04920 [Shewanella hanedai]GGI79516.1 lipoprotein [Shewanella hanedai]